MGIPLACVCVFFLDMGLFGLWLGPDVAIIFIFITISILIARVDWKEEIKNEAKKREEQKKLLTKIDEEQET